MNLSESNEVTGTTVQYWQVAAGSDNRDYSADFLRYGLAFVGGDGPRATMKQVRQGDRIVLKRGTSRIIAAGVVVERAGEHRGEVDDADEQRQWLRDYDGWDLRAYCNVEWHHSGELSPVVGLSRGTIRLVHQSEIRRIAEEIIAATPPRPIDAEPSPTQLVSDVEVLDHLIELGLRPGAAEDLTATIRRIRLLARYYFHKCRWDDIREHEARTFLIIPLLLALGWSEQQIKIELSVPGGRVDIAGFRTPYRRKDKAPNNDECVLILESKGFSQGLDYAHTQGKAYAEEFPACMVVVASNGYCYKAYRRAGVGFAETPSAYLNLLAPRTHYPLDPKENSGALALLSFLMPPGPR